MPPDFADIEYWETRFLTEKKPFEWLSAPDDFLPYIKLALDTVPEDNQNILHIGPGSSELSLSLRGIVSRPQKVHNIDYSLNAIKLGKAKECDSLRDGTHETMRWSCMNLLEPQDICKVTAEDHFGLQYSTIVDKSSTDSIACGPDAVLNPRLFRTVSMDAAIDNDFSKTMSEDRKVHPVILLALHLAVLAAPGAFWLCLSYSNERFDVFFDEKESTKVIASLGPARYWTLENTQPVSVAKKAECDLGGSVNSSVHRPQLTYWLYTLRRTDEGLDLFGS